MRLCGFLVAVAVAVLSGPAAGGQTQADRGAGSAAPPGADAEWPGWGGPRGDFTLADRPLAATWPARGPRRLWTRPLGEGHSGIVVDRSRLYTSYRPSAGGKGRFAAEEVVIALDAATGRTLWEHRYPASLDTMDFSRGAGPHTTPRLIGDRVFAAGTNKQLFALDKVSGRVLWSHDLVKEFGAPPNQMRFGVPPGYAPSPIGYKDLIIVMAGGPHQGAIAFRQDDGRVVWKGGHFPDDISPASPILIEADGGTQLVVTSGDGVHGMNPDTGEMLWSFAFPTQYGANMTTPLWSPHDRLLFMTAAYDGGTRVLELGRSNGAWAAKELWYSNKMRVHFTNVVRIGDFYYGSSGDFGPSFLTAIRARTGEVVWQNRSFSKANLILVNGHAILLDEDGALALTTLSPDKLTVHAKAEVLTGTSWTVPSLAGSTLYLRDRSNITALDLGTP
jgi:outer membrane protein assembly factor BamB